MYTLWLQLTCNQTSVGIVLQMKNVICYQEA